MEYLILIHVLSAIIGIGPTYFGHVLLRQNQSLDELRASLELARQIRVVSKNRWKYCAHHWLNPRVYWRLRCICSIVDYRLTCCLCSHSSFSDRCHHASSKKIIRMGLRHH